MRFMLSAACVAALAFTSYQAAAQTSVDCDAARCAVQDAIVACQSRNGAPVTNHGQFVSCVARAMNRLAKAGTIPRQCKGKINRCAARSTFGKPAGFVTCTITTFGTCDLTTGSPTFGTCTSGTLASGLPACAADTDCIASSRCSIKSSADLCTAAGGVAGNGTCCTACSAPAP